MTDTTKNNVPDGFILLQTQNGAPKYAACMTGRLAGWLMKKYPDGNWVSERKLTNLEVMQAEDQRDDGIVHETPAATIQEPVMVAEPVGFVLPEALVLYEAERETITGYSADQMLAVFRAGQAAPMVADPAGEALSEKEIDFVQRVLASPGNKLNGEGESTDYSEGAEINALWKRPEERNVVIVMGSYKWRVNPRLAKEVSDATRHIIANFAAPLADKTEGAA